MQMPLLLQSPERVFLFPLERVFYTVGGKCMECTQTMWVGCKSRVKQREGGRFPAYNTGRRTQERQNTEGGGENIDEGII